MTTPNTPASRRLFVSMMVSIDGFIEGPNRELDWPDSSNPAFDRYCDEMIDSIDLALFGRRSYEMMAGYWPAAEVSPRSPHEREFARKMNRLPKVVLSRTLTSADAWSETRVLRADDADAILALKRQPGKSIAVWGGAEIVRSLTELRVVDEYRLIVHPTVLGRGTPLFTGVKDRFSMNLVRTIALGSRLAVLCYEPSWA